MCVFCAAVPMAASLGAVATAKQKKAHRQQIESNEAMPTSDDTQPTARRIPAEGITMIVITGLVVGSVIYHSQITPV